MSKPFTQLTLAGIAHAEPHPGNRRTRAARKELSPRYLLRQKCAEQPTIPIPRCWRPSPDALAAADGLSPRVRAYVRDLVGRDPTEGIAQLARSGPGALIFACALATSRASGPSEHLVAGKLIRGVQTGEPLRGLLAEIVHVRCALESYRVAGWTRPLQLAECSPKSHRRLALLIQRATAGVEPSHLLAALGRAHVPEDVPRQPAKNRRWFRVMGVHLPDRAPATPVHDAVLRLVSRHTEALAVLKGGPHGAIVRLLRFCGAVGRFPSRQTDLVKLLDEAARWERHETRDRRLLERSSREAFPSPPVPGIRENDVAIEPLDSADKLVEQGRALDQCIASLAHRVTGRRSYFYAVRVGGARSTVELWHRAGLWRPIEHRAAHNAAPSARECEIVVDWLRRFLLDGYGFGR